MLTGKVLDKFKFNGKEAKIRYETMGDAEDYKELKNSLVDEGAKIGSQKKVDMGEAVEKVTDSLKDIAKREGVYLVLEVDDEAEEVKGVVSKYEQDDSPFLTNDSLSLFLWWFFALNFQKD